MLRTVAEIKTCSPEEMTFFFLGNVGSEIGTISQAISSQTSVRRLRFSGYSDIGKLAGSAKDLPLLEELKVKGVSLYTPAVKDDGLGFRSLTTFAALGTPVLIHNLLHTIGSDRLSRVALFYRTRGFIELRREMIAELQRFRLHLANLRLVVDTGLLWEVFEPVLSLAELQTFDLEYTQTDSSLRLQLLSEHITLQSLAYIATHCPNLRKLAVTFDARASSNPPASRDVGNFVPSKNALELFDVMGSKFDGGDEEKSANVFRFWWPKARLCRSEADSRPMGYWEIDDAPIWPNAD
ncbi:hypothetical protein FRC01_004123 [Tulasnella sp. 417]|nr:hypothetical protein FRC01_004123 [Tulasnella sp. 417]